MVGNIWKFIDSATEVFWKFIGSATKVFVRICVQIFLVFSFGIVLYIFISALPRGWSTFFQVLFFFFVSLYILFSFFSFICLITKLQSKRLLPSWEGGDTHATVFYKALWKVEALVGIGGFSLRDRYRYWSFMHYLISVVMFVNATYCLSLGGSMLPPGSLFSDLDPVENIRYTFDLLHKSIIVSEAFAHFDKYISTLPHTFKEINFESLYFFSFKIVSALLLISVLTMLFDPSFSRARSRRGRG